MDIIIVGAGAAGLMAAKKLSESGLEVSVVEARDRTGGRIHSMKSMSGLSLEGGAEFIHGNLEVTLDLLKEAGIEKEEYNGEMWQVTNGQWSHENNFFANAEIVIKKLKSLTQDISMGRFTALHFSEDRYESLRRALTSYIEGYYSGEIEKISAKSFLKEWLSEDEQQYRPVGGYGKLMNYLLESSKEAGATVHLSTAVKEIRWGEGDVKIIGEENSEYCASKALITVPLGVWTSEKNEKGAIKYFPELSSKVEAAKKMGFGSVIKILLEFEDVFWEDIAKKQKEVDTTRIQMIFSEVPIPTWWTQFPQRLPLLTGWLSGPKAEKMKDETDDGILQNALYSLAQIFGFDSNMIRKKLRWSRVFNWTADGFTLGSYSYSTLETIKARKILSEPIQNTLFFAGEALYEGPEMGTVEAALTSGLKAAEDILVA